LGCPGKAFIPSWRIFVLIANQLKTAPSAHFPNLEKQSSDLTFFDAFLTVSDT
jgi:hypothetical protein